MGKNEQYNVQNQNMQNQMVQNQNMYNQNMQNQMMQDQNIQYQNVQNEYMQYRDGYKPVDWDDGKIHTVVSSYDINDPEHWHRRVTYQPQQNDKSFQYIKGRQLGGKIEVNDPRIVIPVLIIIFALFITVSLVLLAIETTRFLGIIFFIVTVAAIVGILKENIPRWKVLFKTLKDDKNKK